MRVEADPETAAWLEELINQRDIFDWDPGNRTKHRKHGVEAEDIESLVAAPFVFEGRIREPAHNEPRWLLLGQDAVGRRLALIFTRRGDLLRPISCRPMRTKEKKRYEETLKLAEGED